MSQAALDQVVELEYQFSFRDGVRECFKIQLHRPDLRRINPPKGEHPAWARLAHCQCPDCPLDPATTPYCPAAVSLSDVIETFRDCLSTESAEVWIVGPARELGQRTLLADEVNYVDGVPPSGPTRVQAKIRYRALLADATWVPLPGGQARVEFDAPLRDITPGQAVVAYQGDVVLGGGIINR